MHLYFLPTWIPKASNDRKHAHKLLGFATFSNTKVACCVRFPTISLNLCKRLSVQNCAKQFVAAATSSTCLSSSLSSSASPSITGGILSSPSSRSSLSPSSSCPGLAKGFFLLLIYCGGVFLPVWWSGPPHDWPNSQLSKKEPSSVGTVVS